MFDHTSPGVLIVDDEPDILALLQSVLRHHGFRVFLAPTGQKAAEVFRVCRDAIHLVLLDVEMPDWDGPRTLRELRAADPRIVCCFVTGSVAESAERELLALGAARVVRKPFEPAELARQLWGLVGPFDRRAGRQPPKQVTRVALGEGLEPEEVVESWVCDRSPGGLRLRLSRKFGAVGAILSIRPADAAADAPWVPVQVRHAGADGDGWTVGCCYLHPAAAKVV
jgi:CheY-like chemotaxis protein